MLNYDPAKRISAKQALTDPWVLKHAPNKIVSKKVLDNLQKF